MKVVSFEPVGSSNVKKPSVKVFPTLFHEALPQSLKKLAYKFNVQAMVSSCFLTLISECDIVHIIPPVPTVLYSAILRSLYRFKLGGGNPKVLAHVFHPFHVMMEDFTDGGCKTFWRQNLWLLKHVAPDYVLCINKYLQKFVTQFISDEIVQYVPYPVDIDVFKPTEDKNAARKKLSLPTDKFLIGYLGQIYRKRGIFTLLDAFNMVAKSHQNTSLVIATYGLNPEKPHVRFFFDYVKHIEANKQVIVLNEPLERVERFYQAMDLMVLPFTQPYYIMDPPLVLMEALASGIPLVTTPLGAIRELTYDKVNALHVPPENARALSEAIISLAFDPEFCSRLGEHARKTAIKYSFEAIGAQLAETYEGILSARPSLRHSKIQEKP